ncbi:MAG: DUF1398 family protein [Asticcacaulis sp.]|nr:DUF1398 family protein [Asticcacaulis sp.]
MHTSVISVIQDCHEASESDRMNFPQILEKFHFVGIEGYSVDYRRSAKTYYQPDGESLDLSFAPLEVPVAATFDSGRLQAAIREAQANAAGYTYRSFCRKVMLAGCAGYIVSIPGRRVLYFGRTAEIHIEHFPGQA